MLQRSDGAPVRAREATREDTREGTGKRKTAGDEPNVKRPKILSDCNIRTSLRSLDIMSICFVFISLRMSHAKFAVRNFMSVFFSRFGLASLHSEPIATMKHFCVMAATWLIYV